MQVKEILARKGTRVWTIHETSTIRDAVQLLATHGIGALVLLNERSQVSGIISERDIVRALAAHGSDIENDLVSTYATRELIVADIEDDTEGLMNVMTESRIRHVPILTDGVLAGIISIGDVVKACVLELEGENRTLKAYAFGER